MAAISCLTPTWRLRLPVRRDCRKTTQNEIRPQHHSRQSLYWNTHITLNPVVTPHSNRFDPKPHGNIPFVGQAALSCLTLTVIRAECQGASHPGLRGCRYLSVFIYQLQLHPQSVNVCVLNKQICRSGCRALCGFLALTMIREKNCNELILW